ncbi:MAG: HPF/RaiA family ribosome-associated protein [Cyanobacteria bacterium J06607_15]
MQVKVPLQITFRNLPHSDAIATRIEQQLEKLCHYCDRILLCQVIVEVPHQHHHGKNSYHIRINLSLPGEELVISKSKSGNDCDNAYIVIRDAFNAAQRKLKRFAEPQKA